MSLSLIHLVHSGYARHSATRGFTPTRCSVYKNIYLGRSESIFSRASLRIKKFLLSLTRCTLRNSTPSNTRTSRMLSQINRSRVILFSKTIGLVTIASVSVLLIRKHYAIVFLISATWSIQMSHVSVESLCCCCAQVST
jgi:hypothetical protein